MGRELNQREKELCEQLSAETNPHRILALVTELNDLLQNQPVQELRVQTRGLTRFRAVDFQKASSRAYTISSSGPSSRPRLSVLRP